jgi:hypothetical protein
LVSDSNDRGDDVIWWGFGGLFAFLYLVLIFTMGLMTLRKGHWVDVRPRVLPPLFWIIGSLMSPRSGVAQPG